MPVSGEKADYCTGYEEDNENCQPPNVELESISLKRPGHGVHGYDVEQYGDEYDFDDHSPLKGVGDELIVAFDIERQLLIEMLDFDQHSVEVVEEVDALRAVVLDGDVAG